MATVLAINEIRVSCYVMLSQFETQGPQWTHIGPGHSLSKHVHSTHLINQFYCVDTPDKARVKGAPAQILPCYKWYSVNVVHGWPLH